MRPSGEHVRLLWERSADPRIGGKRLQRPDVLRRPAWVDRLFERVREREQLWLTEESRIHPHSCGFPFCGNADRDGDVRITGDGGRLSCKTVTRSHNRIDSSR